MFLGTTPRGRGSFPTSPPQPSLLITWPGGGGRQQRGWVSTQHCCKGQKPPPGLTPGQWLNFTKGLLRFLEGCTDNTPTWQKTVISQHFETKLALLGLSRKGDWRQGSLEGLVPHPVTAVPVSKFLLFVLDQGPSHNLILT